jgi:hypothetical protein
LLSNNAPASKLLSKNSSLGQQVPLENFLERFRTEKSFQETFPASKLLCMSIVDKQFSCENSSVWFLQNHSDYSGIIQILPGRSFLMKQSSHHKAKHKQKTFISQIETILLLEVSRSEIR